jgi:hypothetical protein
MPKATVDEDGDFVLRKADVWATRKIFHIESGTSNFFSA